MSASSSILDTFFEECEDLLEALTEGLTSIQDGAQDAETVNAVFRAVHSIKGGAGAFGLDELVSFAHTFENVLDLLRSEKIGFNSDLMLLLLRSSDQLANLVEAARDDVAVDEATSTAILELLQTYIGDEPEEEVVFAPMTLDLGGDLPPLTAAEETFVIRFIPNETLYKNGHEPVFFFKSLAELGEITVSSDASDIPMLADLDPSSSYMSFEVRLSTTAAQHQIEEIFEFVETLCDIDIQTHSDTSGAPQEETPSQQIPQLSVPDVPAASEAKAPKEPKTHKPTVRVDLDRIDRLMNTVGELIINQAMLSQRVSELDSLGTREIESQLENYQMLARDLQEDVMAIRAQPVKPLFQRMARIVREASAATGKSARLVMEGEATEVDKTVIERLADPLTHMIRNAVDHGLEDIEGRRAAGKSEEGEVKLSATHRSGNVFIEIIDDGAGLNRQKIFEIAVSKGLTQENADLSDSEIDNLLFMPGFSTASSVSNLSGRGVGMDVVKNAVTALGGRVSISSEFGVGTKFSIVLPLTLAVMDGMVILVAGQTMVVPITSILETIRPSEEDIHELGPDGPLLSIRGRFVPIVDVAAALGFEETGADKTDKILILLETQNAGQCALAVDAIVDQRQVVIKSLDGVDDHTPGVAAATILGDGKIAMILDPDGVVNISAELKRSVTQTGDMLDAKAN